MTEQFKQYPRIAIAEMRQVTEEEIANGVDPRISISEADRENGSPKAGDMVARNPKDHTDMWLVAKAYFEENFGSATDEIPTDMKLYKRALETEMEKTLESAKRQRDLIEACDKVEGADDEFAAWLLIKITRYAESAQELQK